jgi:hypothetical protein
VNHFFIWIRIAATKREVDAKRTLRQYRRTTISKELLDNKRAMLSRPSHGAN